MPKKVLERGTPATISQAVAALETSSVVRVGGKVLNLIGQGDAVLFLRMQELGSFSM